jgi:hypothetical protein
MSIYSKISGWQLTPDAKVKVNGSWQNATFGYVKVNGTWNVFYTASGSNVTNFRFTQTLNDSVAFGWDAGEDVVSYQLWYSKKPDTEQFFPESVKHPTEVTSTYTNQTGKITLSTGSKEINGIGTSFNSLSVGNNLYVTENSVRIYLGKIVSITNNTKLTVTKTWSGSTYNAPGIDFVSQNNGSISFNTERENTYKFYIVPVGDDSVPGNRSPILTRVTPVAVPQPDVVSDQVINPGNQILTWSANPRASFYELWTDEGRTVGDYAYVKRIERSGGTQESHTEQDYRNAASYRMVIKSVNSLYERSANSNAITFSFVYKPPSLVATTLNATASGILEADLSWASNSNASSYNVFVDGVNVKNVLKSGTSTEKYTYKGKDESTNYAIKIQHVGNTSPEQVSPATIFSNTITLKTGNAAVTKTTTTAKTKTATYVNGQYQYYLEWQSATRRTRNSAWSAWSFLRNDRLQTETSLPAKFDSPTEAWVQLSFTSTALTKYRRRYHNLNFSRNFDFGLGLTQTEKDDGVIRTYDSWAYFNLTRSGFPAISTDRYGTKLSGYGVNIAGGGYRGANETVDGLLRRVRVNFTDKVTTTTTAKKNASIA